MKSRDKTRQELLEELDEAYQVIEELQDEKNKMKYSKFSSKFYSNDILPKEMSDWFDYKINYGDARTIFDKGHKGYIMKSTDCSIILFPNWNCDEQFARISNRFD